MVICVFPRLRTQLFGQYSHLNFNTRDKIDKSYVKCVSIHQVHTQAIRLYPFLWSFLYFHSFALSFSASTRTWTSINGSKPTNTMQNLCLSIRYTPRLYDNISFYGHLCISTASHSAFRPVLALELQ